MPEIPMWSVHPKVLSARWEVYDIYPVIPAFRRSYSFVTPEEALSLAQREWEGHDGAV